MYENVCSVSKNAHYACAGVRFQHVKVNVPNDKLPNVMYLNVLSILPSFFDRKHIINKSNMLYQSSLKDKQLLQTEEKNNFDRDCQENIQNFPGWTSAEEVMLF